MTNSNTLNTTLLNQVISELKQTDTNQVVTIYNDYADQNSYEHIYDNDELTLDDIFTSHFDAIRSAFYGDYNPSHAYFTFNGYGNLQSFEYLDDDNSPIDIEELAQWIVDNELFNDYDIEVTILDDMLASIEDNITDDEDMLKVAINYLGISTMTDEGAKNMTYNEWLISEVMFNLNSYCDYTDVQNTINRLGINYK